MELKPSRTQSMTYSVLAVAEHAQLEGLVPLGQELVGLDQLFAEHHQVLGSLRLAIRGLEPGPELVGVGAHPDLVERVQQEIREAVTLVIAELLRLGPLIAPL